MMLVLKRKIDEVIMIGDDIEIMVVGIHGKFVKLGITTPRDTEIYRQEIYEARKRGEKPRRGGLEPPNGET